MGWTFFVPGLPVAQPRTKAVSFGGHARIYTPKVAEVWKLTVTEKARAAGVKIGAGEAVGIELAFYFPRPKGHFGKKGLLGSAPRHHLKKPDLDNLAKSVMDAIVRGGLLQDDAQVIDLSVRKYWNDEPDHEPGLDVTLYVGEEL